MGSCGIRRADRPVRLLGEGGQVMTSDRRPAETQAEIEPRTNEERHAMIDEAIVRGNIDGMNGRYSEAELVRFRARGRAK